MAAIVTGGAQGIGASLCVVLLREGYKVCVADVLEEKGKEFVGKQQKIHGNEKIIFSHCDVTKESDFSKTFELAIAAFQTVDLLVNNAGIGAEGLARKIVDINLMGPIIGCQMAIKFMGKSNGGKGGIVINTASVVGIEPFYRAPLYTASKHGVIGLTRSYGHPYHKEREGLIFAAVCPSITDTCLLKRIKECSIHTAKSDNSNKPQLMSPDFVAEGFMKILNERINGSVLVVTKEKGYWYFEFNKCEGI